MGKKLTQQQQQRIQQRLQHTIADKATPHQMHGLVIVRYGKQIDVKIATNQIIRCEMRQNLGEAVVGDEILIKLNSETTGIALGILPRKSVFSRKLSPLNEKILAANIDQVFIVCAPLPKFSGALLDSYLVALSMLNLPAKIVFNKCDQWNPTHHEFFEQIAQIYQRFGYEIIISSCETGIGLNDLAQRMQGKINILVGQSGVGKSSIIQRILPQENIRIGDVSEKTAHGKHTTTAACFYSLQPQGGIIDSPGVRDFALWNSSAREIAEHFIEFNPYLGRCKFSDCQHLINDESCALAQAYKAGEISEYRLMNYQTLVQQYAQMK